MKNTIAFTMLFLFGSVSLLSAKQCEFQLTAAKPVLLAGKKQTVGLKVGVKGFELKSEKERSPLNVAIVIDRSGSMSGAKMERAKEAAIQALQCLDSRDIVSLVTFDDSVNVVVPATKLTDRSKVEQAIKSIKAGGSTALYDGIKKGGEEVKKFLEKEYVNRIVLLSDGQANVGPSSSEEIAKLGKAIAGRGITVSTFGLGDGYNEDLMAKLALASDGNHKFIEGADKLADIFQKEFNSALSVVAQDVACTVTLPDNVRPVRALNMTENVDIKGQTVTFGWNQLYSRHERFVMLEVEVPATEDGKKIELAKAALKYLNMETKDMDHLSSKADVRFSDSESQVKESVNKPVMEDYVELLANAETERAIKLRDSGDVSGAQKIFMSNSSMLRGYAKDLGGSLRLNQSAGDNDLYHRQVDSPSWSSDRKMLRERQNSAHTQQLF
ncbi:MAG: VWA domain-containing protein [Planctomycetaceae bacterium]|jgi:Ca-activated chloride channel family protein|nr:VWA domain-containing protein [Planctomycetaceae bacterium]